MHLLVVTPEMLAALQKVFAGPLLGCLQARFSSEDVLSASALCVCCTVVRVFPALLCQPEEVEISAGHLAQTRVSHGKLLEKCLTQY